MAELIQCSRCRSRKLPEFYSIKSMTGIRYKTCDSCHDRSKPKKDGVITCQFCEFRTKTNEYLVRHMKAIHNQQCPQIRDLQCPLCEFTCTRASILASHRKYIHDKIRDHKCPHCDLKCVSSGEIKRHVQAVHEKIRDHRCPHCEFASFELKSLKNHIKAIHDQTRDQTCTLCDFSTTTQKLLIGHQKTCTGRLPMSAGEFVIKGVLESRNIPFEQEKRFLNCQYQRPLPFDFYIQSCRVAIEYDGIQHFKSIKHWGGIPKLEATKQRDAIKTEYCAANGIRLLRIKYTDFALIPTLIENFLSSVEESSADGNHDTINATSNEIGGIEPIQAQNPDLPQ